MVGLFGLPLTENDGFKIPKIMGLEFGKNSGFLNFKYGHVWYLYQISQMYPRWRTSWRKNSSYIFGDLFFSETPWIFRIPSKNHPGEHFLHVMGVFCFRCSVFYVFVMLLKLGCFRRPKGDDEPFKVPFRHLLKVHRSKFSNHRKLVLKRHQLWLLLLQFQSNQQWDMWKHRFFNGFLCIVSTRRRNQFENTLFFGLDVFYWT